MDCDVIPELPGVYAIYLESFRTKKSKLIYIGSSKNLYLRLEVRKHNIFYRRKIICSQVLNGGIFMFIKIKKCNNFSCIEKKLINKLRPVLNKNGKL